MLQLRPDNDKCTGHTSFHFHPYPSLSFLSNFAVKLFVLEDEPPKVCHVWSHLCESWPWSSSFLPPPPRKTHLWHLLFAKCATPGLTWGICLLLGQDFKSPNSGREMVCLFPKLKHTHLLEPCSHFRGDHSQALAPISFSAFASTLYLLLCLHLPSTSFSSSFSLLPRLSSSSVRTEGGYWMLVKRNPVLALISIML